MSMFIYVCCVSVKVKALGYQQREKINILEWEKTAKCHTFVVHKYWIS